MSGEDLPAPVRRFIVDHLSSVEQVEVLAVLVSSPDTPWTADAVYRKVLTTPASIGTVLTKFLEAEFVVRQQSDPPEFRLALTGDRRETAIEVCRCYREMPVRVINAIYRVDRSPADDFAEAFRIKPRPPRS